MKTTVDGIARFGKLMNMWPARYVDQYTHITATEFDDIMQTIDYEMSNWNDCSEVHCRFGSIGYVQGRDADAQILLSNKFLASIKYVPAG
jgi:hypothetical protein